MKLLIALVLLSAIAICTLLPSQIHSTKKKVTSQRDLASHNIKNNPSSDETPPTETKSPKQATSAKSDKTEGQNPASENTREPIDISHIPPVSVAKDRLDRLYIALTVVLVFIGGVTLVLIWEQAKATTRAAQAAEVGANATKDNIELIVRKERARIRVEMRPLTLAPAGKTQYVEFTVLFYGTTPAFITNYGNDPRVSDSFNPAIQR